RAIGKQSQPLRDEASRSRRLLLARTMKERPEALVQLGRDERQRFELTRAPERPVDPERGAVSRDPVENGEVLGHDLAAVENQRRHIALWIDLGVVGAGLGDLRLQIDALGLERSARFEQRDVNGETAGTRGIVELHETSPSGWNSRQIASARRLVAWLIGICGDAAP